MEMKKSNLSQHEKSIIEVLSCVVADQRISIMDAEGINYRSYAKSTRGETTTTYFYFERFGEEKLFLRKVYDHNTGKETEFWRVQ